MEHVGTAKLYFLIMSDMLETVSAFRRYVYSPTVTEDRRWQYKSWRKRKG
jgi:hypothetical protein